MTRQQELRGAMPVPIDVVRELIDGPVNPIHPIVSQFAGRESIAIYSLACALIEYVDLNEDKFRTIQAYCRAASEDKAKLSRFDEAVRLAKEIREEDIALGPYERHDTDVNRLIALLDGGKEGE